MKTFIVTYSVYNSEDGLYTDAHAFDNEADADNCFNNYILDCVMESFDGTSEEFQTEYDRLQQLAEQHPTQKTLNVEIDDYTYCVCLFER